MNQEQEKFQKSLRELLAFAKEQGQKITAKQAEHFFEEQGLSDAQRAMVYEYLSMEQIGVDGAGIQHKEKRSQIPLTAEEEKFVKRYLDELPPAKTPDEEEKRALFHAAAQGDGIARSRLLAYYMPKLPEIARPLHDGSMFFGDLIQEGNVSLLLALETLDEGQGENNLLEQIREGIRQMLEEQQYQKRQDEAVVGKVNRLKEAIEDLSDGENMDFSIAELSAYLDMSVEEIEDILRLTGEET